MNEYVAMHRIFDKALQGEPGTFGAEAAAGLDIVGDCNGESR